MMTNARASSINLQPTRQIISLWTIAMLFIWAFAGVARFATRHEGGSEPLSQSFATISLFAVIVVCAWAGLALTRRNRILLFTPLVAFAASSAMFFGFGPLSSFFASDTTKFFQLNSVYAATPSEVLRAVTLSSLGIAVILFFTRLTMPSTLSIGSKGEQTVLSRLDSVALMFVVTGLILKHLIIMPSIYGTSDFFVPGALRNLRYLPDLGFALLALSAVRGSRLSALIFWILWPPHFLLAFPEFSKRSVMMTMLLPALGAYIGHRSFVRLSIWVVAAISLFTVLQNANAVGRWELSEARQYGEVVSLRERLEIMSEISFFGGDFDQYIPDAKRDVEMWWLRLDYSGAQAAAMELHDDGITGEFTQNPMIYFIPRFIWPDKPTIVSPGQEFHGIVTGNPYNTTKVGITVFADGYWKYGWPGVVLFSALIGIIFGFMTRVTVSQLSRQRYLYLPASLIGLQMGATSMTAFLQNAVISAMSVYFGYLFLVYCFYLVTRRKQTAKFSSGYRRSARVQVASV